MTRVTHRVTQLHHQHTKPGGGREKWLHTRHLNKQYNYLRSTHLSPHPTTIGWREEMCICHLSLRTIKQNQIGVLWGKQSSLTIPACKHAKTPDTNSARGLIYCRPLIKCVWWVHLARNRYETLPSCKGEPPRQFLGRIPPHTSPKCAPPIWNPPHGREDAQRRAWHTHATRTTLCVHARPQWYQNNLIGIMHISHHQKDEQSRKSTSCSCSGLHLVTLYINCTFVHNMELAFIVNFLSHLKMHA